MIRTLLTYVLVICCTVTYSQMQTNNWLFPVLNGFDFSSGSPVYTTGGQVGRSGGCATISDKNGQLLFYTDGIGVWDRNHAGMPNGANLAGGTGVSTQAAVIVPKTEDGLEYYIFTTDDYGRSKGLQYSIVDMNLNSGLGDVSVKNIPLITPVCSQVTAVRHCNKKDYWIITHRYASDAYYAYLVTATGVNPTPVISHTGGLISAGVYTWVGVIKASPDGKKLASSYGNIGLYLSDFNNQTGMVSNAADIYFQSFPGLFQGIEFSSDNKLLYVSLYYYWNQSELKHYSGIFQYDVSLPTIPAIRNSVVQLSQYSDSFHLGSLQMGRDGKIYMSQYEKSYLSVINSPEIYGMGCNLVDTAIVLPNFGSLGLPNFIHKYSPIDSFSFSSGVLCANTPVAFNYTLDNNINSVSWNFNDPSTGAQNFSTLTNPVHIFSSAGTYNVTLIEYGVCINDTLIQQVNISGVPVNLGSDTGFCENSSLLLDPQSPWSNTYLWQDGSTSPTYTASAAGLYWVEVTSNNNTCFMRDSINVSSKPLPVINLGEDTALCVGQTKILDAQNAGGQYLWQNNSTQQTLAINQDGTYWVQVDMNGCLGSDTVNIYKAFKPQFSLGPDQLLCSGQTLLLTPALQDVNYLWQDGSTNSSYLVSNNGLYYVDISNNCGTLRDSINIQRGICEIYIPSAFTPNGDGNNDYFKVGGVSLFPEFEMKIFNRYGELIFISKDKNTGWNGKIKGKDSPAGVYVYSISYRYYSDTPVSQLNGTVVLLR